VLKWILARANNEVEVKDTPIGLLPNPADLDLSGLSIPKEKMEKLFEIDRQGWQSEVQDIDKYLSQFGDHLPAEIRRQRETLAKRLG